MGSSASLSWVAKSLPAARESRAFARVLIRRTALFTLVLLANGILVLLYLLSRGHPVALAALVVAIVGLLVGLLFSPGRRWSLGSLSAAIRSVFDRALALAMLIVVAPALIVFGGVALAVSGRLFAKELRIGQHGRPFVFLSLDFSPERSTSTWLVALAASLERLDFDSVPLLINVLRGDLAFFGPPAPRPGELLKEPFDIAVLDVKPGVAGSLRALFDSWRPRKSLMYDETVFDLWATRASAATSDDALVNFGPRVRLMLVRVPRIESGRAFVLPFLLTALEGDKDVINSIAGRIGTPPRYLAATAADSESLFGAAWSAWRWDELSEESVAR